MEWNDLRYFLTLARSGSLSAAARELSVEHTTIGRRVSALEAALGVRLFDRLPRGWRLTAEGRDLVGAAEAVESSAHAFELQSRAAYTARTPVRVSASPVFVTHFFLSHVRALIDQQPDIAIEMLANHRGADLLKGEADVAVRVGTPEVPPGLIVRDLGSVGYGLYGVPSILRRPAREHVFCGFDASMSGYPQKQWLDSFAAARTVVFRSNDLFALYLAAKAGVGIALLPHFLVEASDGLRRLVVEGVNFARPLSLILHPDLRRSPRIRAVAQFLTDAVKRERAVLMGTPRGAQLGPPTPGARAPARG